MRIAICSDSHDNMRNIIIFTKTAIRKKIELVIHLGDFIAPFAIKPLIDESPFTQFIGIFGNNDGELIFLDHTANGTILKGPVEKTFDNRSFMLMHEPFSLEKLSNEFDFVCYGHTHAASIIKTKRGAIINPGELCGYLTNKATYVTIDTKTNDIKLEEAR